MQRPRLQAVRGIHFAHRGVNLIPQSSMPLDLMLPKGRDTYATGAPSPGRDSEHTLNTASSSEKTDALERQIPHEVLTSEAGGVFTVGDVAPKPGPPDGGWKRQKAG